MAVKKAAGRTPAKKTEDKKPPVKATPKPPARRERKGVLREKVDDLEEIKRVEADRKRRRGK